MTPLRLPRQFASILARGQEGAICTAFLLCLSPAPAQGPAGQQTAPERPALGPATRGRTQATTEQLARATAEIETVGFINRMEMGVGGYSYDQPKPVALLRSGDALLEIGNLNGASSVEADRAAHPKAWGRWKRTVGGIELLQGNRWKKLDYARTMERLPAGFALSGDFRHIGGGGNAAFGGSGVIVQENRYTFRPDGTYISDRSRSLIDPRVTLGTKGPALQGRYRVDGYLLRLEPPGGAPETHVISTYPMDPTVIWIDGRVYIRRR